MRDAPPIVDLPKEQRAVRRKAIFALAVCVLTLGVATVGLPRLFAFPDDLIERLAFAVRANLVIGLWVMLAVRMVAKVRFESAQDNAGSAYSQPSARLAVPAAFLQNTLEQGAIAALGNLALATVAGRQPLAYMVATVLLFSLGRVTFLRGYPHGASGRAFGIVTTVLPTMGAYLWTIIDMVLVVFSIHSHR